MSAQNSIVFYIVFFMVVAFHVPTTFGFETCSETIRSVCDCIFYPIFSIRCSHKNFNEYPDFRTVQHTVKKLDLSYNNLAKFPPNLNRYYALNTLDLSNNRLEYIPNDVEFPASLRHLMLSYNNISNWISLNPNTFLESAINLESLSLAGNPLGPYNGIDDRMILISSSLKVLNLSNCEITKITGTLMLSGLVNLEQLILSANPLYTLPDLQAFNLLSLDVSACKLAMLRRTIFTNMPMLTFANFSENHRITLVQRNDEYVESVSLRQIDLSNCNMNAVELKGFANLTAANLNGNLITELLNDTFENNVLLESLDLSSNAISRISAMAFQWLSQLRSLDLSLNMIRHIEPNTFVDNLQLISINLSRNFIDHFRSFTSQSIKCLNMSRCEITTIDEDAIDAMPELIELDLSYNWFNELPHKIGSPFLQILDLSRCRLSSIDNHTFSSFPELSRLNLVGNRLTTTFRKEYFAHNVYLNEIWLGDNPWRCECDKKSHDFFLYITERPSKLKDRSQLRCYSSSNARGVLWDIACSEQWDGSHRRIGAAEKVWTMAMGILIAITVLYSVVYGTRWWVQYRRETQEEQQRQENIETTRDLMRHNQMVLEQQSQLNAPDPRETHPPCYADAIRMPRLKTSFTSLKLSGFGSNESDIRRATKRARSEETLGASDLNLNQRTILTARSKKTLHKLIGNSGESSRSVTALINNDSLITNEFTQRSFEIIKQLETEDGHSPYAKRKPQPSVECHKQTISENRNNIQKIDSFDVSLDLSENPHTSQSFFASNVSPYPTSSSSSFSSSTSIESEDYVRLPTQSSFSFKHSDV